MDKVLRYETFSKHLFPFNSDIDELEGDSDGWGGDTLHPDGTLTYFNSKEMYCKIRRSIWESKKYSDLSAYVARFIDDIADEYHRELQFLSNALEESSIDMYCACDGWILFSEERVRNFIVIKALEILGSEHHFGACDSGTYNKWIAAFYEKQIPKEIIELGIREGDSYKAYAGM